MTEVLGVLIAELVEVGEDDRGSLLFRDLAESSGDLPRPLQQVLFDTADSIAGWPYCRLPCDRGNTHRLARGAGCTTARSAQ
jgi:hypothetical protein